LRRPGRRARAHDRPGSTPARVDRSRLVARSGTPGDGGET